MEQPQSKCSSIILSLGTCVILFNVGSMLLSAMVAALSEVDVDWYELGIHLCIPSAKLNAIKKNHNSSQGQLIQMLIYRQRNGELSWEKIIEALEKIGGHANLIISIQSTYITPGNTLA